MTIYKDDSGTYHADVRVVGVGRWHGSLRTKQKPTAQVHYEAVRRLFREAKGQHGDARKALIEQLRSGELPIERLASMIASNEALVPAVAIGTLMVWPTFDAAMSDYLDAIAANPKRRHSTWEAAGAQLRRAANFVTPDGVRLGGLRLDQFTNAHALAYQQSLIDAKAKPNTISGYVNRIGALYRWVAKRETRAAIEAKRPAVALHSPLDRETQWTETTRRDRWLTRKEARAVMDATPDQFKVIVALGLFAGLRLGEALTLRPSQDIDLKIGILTIQPKLLGVLTDGTEVWWKPKTRRSHRVVPISDELRPYLEWQIANRASDAWLTPAIGLPGWPMPVNSFGKHFTVIVERAGLIAGRSDPRGATAHGLRHTFASWLVMAGIDMYTVAELMGDDIKTVAATYAHLAPDFKLKAVNALRNALAAAEAQ